MSIRFNPLIFGGLDLTGGAAGAVQWKQPVADEASLPMAGNAPGDARVVLDTDKIYVWDDSTSKWIDSNLTAAAFGATPNAEGITISTVNETVSGVDITRSTINLEPADSSNPGAVSTVAQSFAGDKTFDNNVIVVGSIDAQTGIDASTGTLKLGQANTTTVYLGDYDGGNTTSIEVAANINGNGYNIDNVGLLTNVGAFSAVPTGNDGVNVSISTNTGSGIGSDSSNILFTESNPFDSQILYIAGGHLAVTATTDITIDSPIVNLGQIGGTTTAYGDVVLDSPNVDIGQAGGTTDIVGTVTIEYNPADPTDWAPAPNDVIEAIDQLAERFVEQDQVTKEPTGFPNRTDSTISFSDSAPARTFTIAPAIPGGSYDFYVKGKKFTKTTSESIQISAVAGNHYIYFNDLGVLQESTDPNFVKTIIQEYAIVSDVYWNPDTNLHSYFAEERHGLTMDGATHAYLHTVFGARYLSGLALQGFTIGSGGSNADAQFTSDQGTIRDEDLLLQIASESQIPILYRIGQNWRKKPADAYPVIYSDGVIFTGANGRLPYNQYTGGAWTLTQVANSAFVLVHFFATNDKESGVVGIQGIQTYNSISSARIGANEEISSLSGLPFAEFVPIGSVIFETASSFSNAIKARVLQTDTGANYVDFRGTQLYTPAGEATTHGLLSGLGNDDHFQYLLVDGTRAMSGALDMGTHQINNVVDPSLAQDVATKNYVDSEITSATTGTPNFFAGFDGTGVLSEVPGWVFFDDGSLEIGAQNSITIPPTIDDYISISISPTAAVTSTDLVNLSGVQLNSPINNDITAYNGFQVFGYGTNSPDNFTAFTSQTNYDGTGTNITHYQAGGGSDCSGNAVAFQFNSSGNAATIDGVSLIPSGNATTIQGLNFQPSGTYTDATGLKVDLSSATIINRPVGLDITGGALSSNVTFSTTNSLLTFVDSANVIRPVFEVDAAGITGTDVLMTNLAGFMDFKGDHSGSVIDLGVTSVGFVSQVAVDATKTADNISMCLAGLAIDGTSAGGSVTDAHLYRGSAFSFGGALTIDNLYGLKIENTLSDKATNAWGISVEDSGAENYLAKSLKIGGSTATTNNEIAIEIGSDKSIRVGLATTAQKTALTNLSGLVIYDTDLNKFFGNDGSQWIQLNLSIGDIDQTSFPALDNQAAPANITSFVFSNAVTRGFEAVVTIERSSTYAEYTLKAIQKGASWEMSQDYIGDDTGIAFSITSAGQIQYTSTSTGSGATIKFRAKTV
jgi:hypothetical protein